MEKSNGATAPRSGSRTANSIEMTVQPWNIPTVRKSGGVIRNFIATTGPLLKTLGEPGSGTARGSSTAMTVRLSNGGTGQRSGSRTAGVTETTARLSSTPMATLFGGLAGGN